jgi:type IV secretory pathway TraG/TraD family ATPase VirD4
MIDLFIYAILGLIAIWCLVMAVLPRKRIACQLAGIKWDIGRFCHNFLIVGATGSGKSICVENILHQLFLNVKEVGGIWMDNKGDSHESLVRIAKNHNRLDDIIILEVPFEGRTLYPSQRLNLLTIPGIGPDITAMILADISMRADSKSKNAGFFKDQTTRHVAAGIRFLEHKKVPVTMINLHQFLCNRERMTHLCCHLEEMPVEKNGKATTEMMWVPDNDPEVDHWYHHYLRQGPEQFAGVVSSIENALSPFIPEPVAQVFSSEFPDTVDFNDINTGKIICILCPHSLPREKECLNQFFKSLFFYTGALRYDRRRFGGKSKENLLVAFIDEYQRSAAVTDKNFLDILRAARCSFVAAMQDDCSMIPVVGQDVTPTILGKLRTNIIFHSESAKSAENSAEKFGKRRVWRNSYGSSGGRSSSNRSQVDEYILRPEHFLRMKDTYCAILSTHGKMRKRTKLPLV